jgi:Neuraminidase (sialidase)
MRTKIPALLVGMVTALLGTTVILPISYAQAVPITRQYFNFMNGPLTQAGDGAISEANFKNPPSPICSTSTSTAANVDTDCEGTAPHNETSIAVNPTNLLNQIGSANDYELFLNSGGRTIETVYSRAHVTFDGGQTWTTFPIRFNGYIATGDPAVAFDANGTAYLATLGFVFSQGRSPTETAPDVLVAHSSDGGKTWVGPVRVASGSGSLGSVSIFNDKEYLTAWGNGNAIVTWTVFNLSTSGSYVSSPIFAAVTHDGGNTWSKPNEISGSATFCLGTQGGNACNGDQFSVPTVAADGSIYVAFVNSSDPTTGRDQYLVVKVDPMTGQRIGGPFRVSTIFDGFTDYPINIEGRETYQDSEFRTNPAGNITADPTDASHLAVVWSDMRNSTLPAPSDPYSATTNSDVIVSQSSDGGATWSAPTAITAPDDQFMPWGAYDSSGILRIGYFDRSYDPANHSFGYTLATETTPGSLTFATTQVTTALSDPTQGDRWFSGITVNSAFPHPTRFLGDYSGITAATAVKALWTDFRNTVCFTTRCGAGEDAFYATAP